MGYTSKNLMTGEEVVHYGKLHWMIYFSGVFLIATAIAGYFLREMLLQGVKVEYVMIGTALTAGLGVYNLFSAYITQLSTELAVTNKRIIAKFGLIRRTTIELNHNQVESLMVQQGILDRILGSGTVIIHGTGGNQTPIPSIDSPLYFRRQAMEAAEKACNR